MVNLSRIFRSCTKVSIVHPRLYSTSAGFRPRRSLLYVPGNETKKIKKATGLSADVVVLDCEDGVAMIKKDECRNSIQEIFPTLTFGRSESVIRINSIDTEFASSDLAAVLTGVELPNSIMVPKIESAEQLRWLKNETEKHLENTGAIIKVIGQSETPKGLIDLQSILDEATRKHSILQFEAFVFGSDDYLASIGATRTKDAIELLYARQHFIMYVKGYGLQAIDMVDIDFKDLNGLEEQSNAGVKMGFTGKQVIHPAQIDIVNKCFAPTKKQIEYSQDLVKEFQLHQETGKGAFSFDGKMIDMPSVKQAINVLNLAKVIADT